MSYNYQQLSGRVPEAAVYTQVQVVAPNFVASSYSLTSNALTGLSKSAALSFGSYGAIRLQDTAIINEASFNYGAYSSPEFASPPTLPHKGVHTVVLVPDFVASSYSLTSNALTGLSRSAALSFGNYGGVTFEKAIRLPGELSTFSYSGALDVLFTATDYGNRFACAGATTITFLSSGNVVAFTVIGGLVVSFVGQSLSQFRCDGTTTVTFTGGTGATFLSSGNLDVLFLVLAGQGTRCVTGTGVIPATGEEEANYVF